MDKIRIVILYNRIVIFLNIFTPKNDKISNIVNITMIMFFVINDDSIDVELLVS